MLNRLYFRPSTYKTLFMEAREGIPILPIPMIFPLFVPPKATTLPSTSFRSRNIEISPIMCHEQPLPRYQLKHRPFPTKDICRGNNFRLWYPDLFGFSSISTHDLSIHLFLLVNASKLIVSIHTIEVTFVWIRV